MSDKRDVVLSTLSADFVGNAGNRTHYELFLGLIEDGQLFSVQKDSAVQDVIKRINTALNVRKSRLEGLFLLEQTIEQCSTEIFTNNAITWAKLLLQGLQGHQSTPVTQMTCKVTSLMLSYATDFPELSREFSTSILPPLITSLISSCHEEKTLPILDCLRSCIIYFNGPCGPSRGKIEQLVVPLLDSLDDAISKNASLLYVLLPRCGGGGNLGLKYTEAWTQLSDKLINTTSEILHDLYKDVDYSKKIDQTGDKLEWADPEINQPAHNFIQMRRYKVLCDTLELMLSEEFPAVVKVPGIEIINLLQKATGVNPVSLLKHETRDNVHLAAVLPSIHRASLDLLDTLIKCCGSSLLPYSDKVHQIFNITLDWSATNPNYFGSCRPYQSLRCQVYVTMTTWIQEMGAACGVDRMSSSLMNHCLNDVKPQVDAIKNRGKVKLDSMEQVYSQSSRKRRKHGGGDIGQFTSSRKVDKTANRESCRAALLCLRWFVQSCGPLVSPSQHKVLQTFVIPLLLEICQAPAVYPVPYADESLGQHDENVSVASFCRESLAICDCLVHPRTPSFTFPVSQSEIQTVLDAEEAEQSAKPRHFTVKPITTGPVDAANGQSSSPVKGLARSNSKIDFSKLMKPGSTSQVTSQTEGNDSRQGSGSSDGSSDEEQVRKQSRITAFNTNNSEPITGQVQAGPDDVTSSSPESRESGPEQSEAECNPEPRNPAAVSGLQEGLASMEIDKEERTRVARKRKASESDADEPVAGTSSSVGTSSAAARPHEVSRDQDVDESEDDMPSVAEMMKSFVNAPPDSDSESPE